MRGLSRYYRNKSDASIAVHSTCISLSTFQVKNHIPIHHIHRSTFSSFSTVNSNNVQSKKQWKKKNKNNREKQKSIKIYEISRKNPECKYDQQITTVLFIEISSRIVPLSRRLLKRSPTNKMYRTEEQNDPTDMKNKGISLSDRFPINSGSIVRQREMDRQRTTKKKKEREREKWLVSFAKFLTTRRNKVRRVKQA